MSPAELHFRPITPADVDPLFDLRGCVRENILTRAQLAELGITPASTIAAVEAGLSGWLCAVAGRIAGFVMVRAAAREIVVLAVRPEFERRGIGRELLRRGEEILWRAGCTAIWLWTAPDRTTRAIALFTKSGWRERELRDGRLYFEKGRLEKSAFAGEFPPEAVVAWLLDSDPAIRWQTLRDLTGAAPEAIAAERVRVAVEGFGARLLAQQGDDGRWSGAAWNRGWNSTMHVLMLLRDFGLDPAGESARRALARVRERVTWKGCGPPECDGNAFFAGEVEPCINGQVAAVGAYFGENVSGIIERLLGEQLVDGGWNCEAAHGSSHSSFNTTICVLEALLEYERGAGSDPRVEEARRRGEEYLLARRLFRRLTTGEVIARDRKGGAAWTSFAFPVWWHYDLLRALDYLRRARVAADERVREAIEILVAKRDADGRWPLEVRYPGVMPADLGEREGQPSRWNTLRAWRVLKWYFAHG